MDSLSQFITPVLFLNGSSPDKNSTSFQQILNISSDTWITWYGGSTVQPKAAWVDRYCYCQGYHAISHDTVSSIGLITGYWCWSHLLCTWAEKSIIGNAFCSSAEHNTWATRGQSPDSSHPDHLAMLLKEFQRKMEPFHILIHTARRRRILSERKRRKNIS